MRGRFILPPGVPRMSAAAQDPPASPLSAKREVGMPVEVSELIRGYAGLLDRALARLAFSRAERLGRDVVTEEDVEASLPEALSVTSRELTDAD